jgi:hypothetical protein
MPRIAQDCHKLGFCGFCLACILWVLQAFPGLPVSGRQWLPVFLLVMALLTTLTGLARQLSPQNALAAAGVIALVTAGAGALAILAGAGPNAAHLSGPTFPPGVPWSTPVAWVVLVPNARGVARLALGPWRAAKNYGFWLMGLAGLLLALLDLAMGRCGSWARECWAWPGLAAAPGWQALNVFVLAVVVQLCAIPWLINKKPGTPPPDYHPLWVWALLSLSLLAGGG